MIGGFYFVLPRYAAHRSAAHKAHISRFVFRLYADTDTPQSTPQNAL
jgi:hypothetical protein